MCFIYTSFIWNVIRWNLENVDWSKRKCGNDKWHYKSKFQLLEQSKNACNLNNNNCAWQISTILSCVFFMHLNYSWLLWVCSRENYISCRTSIRLVKEFSRFLQKQSIFCKGAVILVDFWYDVNHCAKTQHKTYEKGLLRLHLITYSCC